MKFLILIISLLFVAGCTKSGGPVMNPIQAAVCDVESVITASAGSLIVAQCGGTDIVACGNAMQTALGNANLCAQAQIANVSKAQMLAGKAKPEGVVGAIACPIAESAVMGFLTAAIPAACGCTKSMDAGALGALLVSACIAAVPI